KMPRECLKIIESKSKVRQTRAKGVVAKVSTSSSTPAVSSEVSELKDLVRALLLDKRNQSLAPASSSTPAPVKADMVRALLLDKKNQSSAQATSSTPAPIKAVEFNCFTCGGIHSYQNCPATSGNVYQDNINETTSIEGIILLKTEGAISTNLLSTKDSFIDPSLEEYSKPRSGTLPGNTVTNPKEDLKGITTRSGVAYKGPTIPTPSKVVKQGAEATKDPVQSTSPQSTAHVQPPVTQSETPV
nr:reverse transcriptase domain-containing protein [Tanacetum cinerariifolium]